jgi:4-amino-4-deoxy-L-arabinose transferase-like glycosyltransferase
VKPEGHRSPRGTNSWTILGIFWLIAAVADRLWFALDRRVPAWDQADYLTGALNYWQAFQNPQWFDGNWWTSLWQLSSKIPPGTYIITALFHQIFGIGGDRAALVNLFFSAILLFSVYGLGSKLFNRKIGLWAAGLCLLFPGLYHVRLDFLLDYPLTAVVALCFYCLTVWKYGADGFGNQTPTSGFGDQTPTSGFGDQTPTDGFGDQTPTSGFGNQTPTSGFGDQTPTSGFGDQTPTSGFGNQTPTSGFGDQTPTSGFGDQTPTSGFGDQTPTWRWSIAFGLSLGLAFMVKQTAILFLFIPILWVVVGSLWRRQWLRVAQLAVSFLLAIAIMYPWYRTNWLLILTGSKRATVDAAIAEGDPALNTIGAWTFYFDLLPDHVSWPLLIVAIVGFLLYGWRRKNNFSGFADQTPTSGFADQTPTDGFADQTPTYHRDNVSHWRWLLVFWVGSYLLCSLNVNKDFRYVLPYLPVVAIFLAYGLNLWPRRRGQQPLTPLKPPFLRGVGGIQVPSLTVGLTFLKPPFLRGVGGIQVPSLTVGLTLLLMGVNLWPINNLSALKPGHHHVYVGQTWPHEKAIAEIIQTQPYLRSTLGVLPSTPTVNQHNLNYYGALANFQVYGRQVGTRRSQVAQDVRSLNWFIAKTGEQGSVPVEAQTATVQAVQQSPDFQLHKTWPLPDGSTLQLYHRQSPPIQVNPINIDPSSQIQLKNITLPTATPPGQPVPITYQWLGNWEQLQNGLVLMTWEQKSPLNPPLEKGENSQPNRWFHDRAIGLGNLHSATIQNSHNNGFQITENIAMLPPGDIAPGIYTLNATYLNRQTGESYPLEVPPVQITIDPNAAANPAPELDLVTQLRSLATALPLGVDRLGPVFDDIGRINQYDAIQDYLTQAKLTLESRLTQEPNNLEFAYNLALAEVVNRDAKGAIAALEKVVQLDPENPYAHGYLAFVNLYDLQPKAAETALKPALELAPNREEFKILNAVSALFQGNPIKTWNAAQGFIPESVQASSQKAVILLLIVIGFCIFGVFLKKYKFFKKT